MTESGSKHDKQIERLIAAGRLEEAHARFRDFLERCDEERDTLLQNQARYASMLEAARLGTRERNDPERNQILWAFVTQLRKFRKEALATYFDVRDREQFFSHIGDRDHFIQEILSIRISPKNYTIDEMLAEGNSSMVYRLRNPVLNRHVIAAVLKIPKLNDKARVDIQSLTSLKHRNIIKVIDYDLSAFPYFVISEYIHGSTLTVALDITGPRPAPQVADWLYQLTDALDYLRSKRIFHSNVRPSKIFVDEEGQIMVSTIDMRAIQDREPAYNRYLDVCMYGSPEALAEFGQPLTGDAVDPLMAKNMCISDQYSLGLTGYRMLTGKDLFQGNTAYEILENRRRFATDKRYRQEKLAALPAAEFDFKGNKKAGLRKILEKLLEEDPRRRYPDLHALLAILHPFTRAGFHRQRPASYSYRRCLSTNREFIGDFYQTFFQRSPEVEKDFRDLGKKRQLVMLQMAIDVLLDLDKQEEKFLKILQSNRHQKYGGMDFETFIDVLLEKVGLNDPLFDAHIAADWQAVRQQAMALVHRSLGERENHAAAS